MAVSRTLPTVIMLSALMAGCSSTGEHHRFIPLPWPHKSAKDHKIDPDLPALPPAGSGRGGYYQDDGPGENPPPGLRDVPDAEVKYEPYAKFANKPYSVFGQTYTPLINDEPFTQRGVASWYGVKFHGQRTSSGELYDMYKMTAAHPVLPIPSYARVTSMESGKSVVVRINDRGPFHSDRIIDVSYTAALKLGLLGKGSHEVKIERMFPNDPARIATTRREATSAAQAVPAPPSIAALMLEDRMEPEPAPVAQSAPPSGFYLQLGSFSKAGKAQEMSERLVQAGLSADSLKVIAAGAVNRLLRGPFSTREQAQKAVAELPAGFGIKPIIVRR
ncbi:septal ring lytic transglycosylase RlpA family protein [Massilia solisilvae]|uniref:Endolytic peptidoglycan transglycosylase RlpA n=1 Tax=Massilia solisilvae TaxID=1811225 RepID=A0ABT2BPJ3_9BURK|nr:septal ring lytic transglycosylase RlpA family protein [Massilia solisilvae]MCS0610437.1 septal ring lytic transglycosylase RlpA family protein [Massilia solisilvae]